MLHGAAHWGALHRRHSAFAKLRNVDYSYWKAEIVSGTLHSIAAMSSKSNRNAKQGSNTRPRNSLEVPEDVIRGFRISRDKYED